VSSVLVSPIQNLPCSLNYTLSDLFFVSLIEVTPRILGWSLSFNESSVHEGTVARGPCRVSNSLVLLRRTQFFPFKFKIICWSFMR
jgi:hypothetical protein